MTKVSYWYLETEKLVQKDLPDKTKARESVLEVALRLKQARLAGELKCPKGEGGCYHCRPFELILARDKSVEKVGANNMNQDLYMIHKKPIS